MPGKGLTKDEIDATSDGEIRLVHVPEWACEANPDGELYLRVMSGSDFARWQMSITREVPVTRADGTKTTETQNELSNGEIKLLACTMCDDEGTLLYEANELNLLQKRSYRVLQRLCLQSQELNQLTAAHFEALVKNFEGGQNGDSGSA